MHSLKDTYDYWMARPNQETRLEYQINKPLQCLGIAMLLIALGIRESWLIDVTWLAVLGLYNVADYVRWMPGDHVHRASDEKAHVILKAWMTLLAPVLYYAHAFSVRLVWQGLGLWALGTLVMLWMEF